MRARESEGRRDDGAVVLMRIDAAHSALYRRRATDGL